MAENQVCSLANRECIPCKGGTPPLQGEQLHQYHSDLGHDWELVEEQRLEKTYKFKNFREALDFTNRVGELAESVGHHPDIFLAWGKVKLTLWTHKISGLTESDFIFAAKVEQL
jgi:4a-hydroxytetrahydrobiopterin dehydratase